MKKRWFEIFQVMLCFFWIPSFIEYVSPFYITGPQAILYIWWAFMNAVCGAYYVWPGIIILASGVLGIRDVIKNVKKNRIFRIAIMLCLMAFNMFGLYYAYQLSELWRYF